MMVAIFTGVLSCTLTIEVGIQLWLYSGLVNSAVPIFSNDLPDRPECHKGLHPPDSSSLFLPWYLVPSFRIPA